MALRWVLIVIADSNAMTDAEEVVRGLGLHAAIAPNLAQAATQARSLRPVLLISDQKPDAASAPPCPVLIVGATIDRVQLKAQILALVPEGSPPPSPAPPPATATPVNAPEPVPTPAAPPPPPPKQWMVITSADPGVAAIVDLALLGLGLDTASAADAGQTAAKASELKPQLILCDLDLPGLEDAAAALANLRRNPGTSAVPLLLIASKDADETLSKAVAGDKTVRFLKKPLDAETLRLELSRLLGGEETPPPAAPEPAEPAPAAPPAAPVSRGAALVLEADPAARGVLEAALKDAGLSMIAGDPAQAMSVLFDLKPALIVSDLKAPGAAELLMSVRMDALLCAIPFLFVADMTPQEVQILLPGGDPATRFAKKPLDPAVVKTLAVALTSAPPA